ncbi:succinoglycan biosynthesis protein ExoA [Thermosipho africanus Ob7]|uniref:glycosyltransferase family 2 protein n=1 Tax=Thermosipho africanus TaxID=2421 RepID=UPI000E0C8734|nr:glycosyltransferase family 2 protein [Thermosipho africanus]RDI90838.1 succinoglycan biosynthesis protein ExoA [Thermosipho africanus Ob7]
MKKVTIVIPTRNEEKHIEKCINSILENDYPKKEIIVVDGMSSDRTREILKGYKDIKIIDNPEKITPIALNIGIKNATGDYIMIAGAHSTYSKNYISECIKRLDEGKCEIAGGKVITRPGSDTKKAIAISKVLSHPFGIGGARYRINPQKEMYVDTVAYGIYKREVFEKVGTFNPNLVRNQDIEMNLRIKNAGMRILLVPNAESYYYARDNFKSLFKNNFQNGLWVILSTKYAKKAFSLRHLVPLFFVLFLLSILFVYKISFLKSVYFSILALYLFLNIFFSLKIALKEKSLKIFFYSFISFLVLHISYGLGSLVGIFKRLFSKG